MSETHCHCGHWWWAHSPDGRHPCEIRGCWCTASSVKAP
jgi:hypothetical protein